MGLRIWHALPMNARDVLAANFQKLRDITPSLNLPKDIVKAGAATNGTIGRITKKETGPSIDTVEKLGAVHAQRMQTLQMLTPPPAPVVVTPAAPVHVPPTRTCTTLPTAYGGYRTVCQ